VFKAYMSRVGTGPMPTELQDEIGDTIRECGQEYGTVTRRPRRCGWFDAVAARLSTQVNGFTSAAVTRLDVLDKLPQLKICTGYKLDGKTIDYFPASVTALERCQPVCEELPGWETSIADVRRFEDLPVQAQKYVNRLEELIGCPASIISVGERREQTIQRMAVM
jgi:adenylosuccinate synthase